MKIVLDKLSKLDSKLSDIWNYFQTMSEGRRQTEPLQSVLMGAPWKSVYFSLFITFSVFSVT